MDSPPAARPVPFFTAQAPAAARPLLARLGRVLPAAAGLARFSYRLAGVSALAAAVVLWVVATRVPGAEAPLLLLLALALLVPAGAALLVGWTLGDLARLPADLAATAEAAARELGTGPRPRGIAGVLVALWAARNVLLAARGGWGRALVGVRLVRLVRLPALLASLGLFLLNGLVILAGLAAAAWAVLS